MIAPQSLHTYQTLHAVRFIRLLGTEQSDSRLVTENMCTSLGATCSMPTWRKGTRCETQESLQVGNDPGCADIVKARRPLNGRC